MSIGIEAHSFTALSWPPVYHRLGPIRWDTALSYIETVAGVALVRVWVLNIALGGLRITYTRSRKVPGQLIKVPEGTNRSSRADE